MSGLALGTLLVLAPASTTEPAALVRDDASLRAALRTAGPDTHIRIAAGRYRPGVWVLRILQETTEKGFAPCRNGRFEHNLVVVRRADVQVFVNVGPQTRPETVTFASNFWYCEDRPEDSRPVLPVAESGGVYSVDPRQEAPAKGLFRPLNKRAAGFGAEAWKPDRAEK